MRIEEPPIEGKLVKRYKRFLTDVELPSGEVITVHCPNTGSLLGCQEPGSAVLLRDSGNPARKYRYTWQAIRVGRTWVNVHTGLPNALVGEAVRDGLVPELLGYDGVRREVPYGENSRIDLLLEGADGRRCYVEIKSTTLARGDVALFPDAVTARGRKHLGELQGVVRAGQRAVQFFLVSRGDVRRFRPADEIDPAYGAALREAAAAGVEVLAYAARVGRRELSLGKRLAVELE